MKIISVRNKNNTFSTFEKKETIFIYKRFSATSFIVDIQFNNGDIKHFSRLKSVNLKELMNLLNIDYNDIRLINIDCISDRKKFFICQYKRIK